MKKAYTRPELVEFGRVDELTLGTTGGQPDLILSGGQLITNPTSPNCTNNGAPYLACVPTP